MTQKLLKAMAPWGIWVVLVAFMALIGCDRAPVSRSEAPHAETPVSTNVVADRQQDPAYRAALKAVEAKRKSVGARRARVAGELQRLYAKAAADFPKDTPPEKIKAALAANPQKYPGWREYSKAFEDVETAWKAVQTEARMTVQRGILKENAARNAVSAGKVAAASAQVSK